LSVKKEAAIHDIVLHVMGRIKFIFAQARGERGQQQQRQDPVLGQPPSGNFRTLRHVNSPGLSRRKKRELGDGNYDEGEEGPDSDPGEGPSNPKDREPAAYYACPYFKYNPHKYKSWRNCPGPGWPDVHRVK
jgi:hypothetical protein